MVMILAGISPVRLMPTAHAATGMVEMLNLTGARQVAMGETAALFDADPFNLEYNPAAIIGPPRGRVGISHNSFIQDRNTSALAFIFPAGGLDFGVHLRLSSLGEIEIRDAATSEPDYIATAHDFSFKVYSAYRVIPGLQAGVSLGWLMEKIDIDRASAFALGLGAVYFTDFGVAVHASAANLGGTFTFKSEENDLPSIYRVGAGYHFREMSVSADYLNIKSGDSRLHVGAEYLIEELLFLRTGYQIGYDNRDFSAGAGFVYKDLRIDYAFVPYQSDLGNSHRFTLMYAFR